MARQKPETGYAPVAISGLRELNRALADLDPMLKAELKGRLVLIGDRVAARVRAKMPERSGRAKRAVKAGANASGAYVQHGRKAVPYTGWLDFGGSLRAVGGRHNSQFREIKRRGRYLYPAIDEMSAQTRQEANAAIAAVLAKAKLR